MKKIDWGFNLTFVFSIIFIICLFASVINWIQVEMNLPSDNLIQTNLHEAIQKQSVAIDYQGVAVSWLGGAVFSLVILLMINIKDVNHIKGD